MLTATYSLVALASEISRMRRILAVLQIQLKNIWKEFHHIDLDEVKYVFKQLMDMDFYCCNRKLERHLVPAMICVSQDAVALFDEWETLRAKGAYLLETITEKMPSISQHKTERVNEACQSMERYCHTLLQRLNKEEDELIPLARSLFAPEQWFSIAEKFLVEDGQIHENKASVSPFPVTAKETSSIPHEMNHNETRTETLL